MIHLDSNLLIALADVSHPHRQTAVRAMRSAVGIAVSSLAWWEFVCGPVSPAGIQLVHRALQGRIVDFTSAHGVEAARIFNAAGRSRRLRFDSLIAATAILAEAELATANPTDFQPFVPHGLKLLPLS